MPALLLFLMVALAACGPSAAPTATNAPQPPVTASPTVGETQGPSSPTASRPTATVAPPTATSVPATPVLQPTKPTAATATTVAAPTKPAAASTKVDVVAKGLDTPWAIDVAPDGRLFVTERPGRIRVIENGQLVAQPWLTLDVYERDGSEAGLMGLVLDPQFVQNRFVYVVHTYQSGARIQNRLVRLREDPGTRRGVVDRVLLDGIAGNNNHDGGRIKFGPDGKLYMTMGEVFVTNLAQEQASPNGKILRLNSDGSVPPDNPIPGSPVYSLGHRNPQGIAWQPGSGRLYATEHGPSGGQGCCHDEVNFVEAGKNYGWPTIRGDQTREGLVTPALHSGSSVTWAPGGAAFVTKGPWAGSFLFTALRGQALLRATVEGPKATVVETLFDQRYGRLRDVVEAPDGSLLLLTSNRDGRGNPAPDDDRVLRLSVS